MSKTKCLVAGTLPRRILRGLAVFVFWILVWEGLSLLVGKEILLPSPLLVGNRLFTLSKESAFWGAVGASLGSVLLGVVVGGLVGILLAVVSYRFSFLRALLAPLVAIVKATPVASFIVLAYVWLSKDTIPGFVSFLMVVPILMGGTMAGLESRSPELLEVTRLYRMPLLRRFACFTLPSLLPSLRAGLLTAVGLGWKAGVAAEAMVRAKDTVGNHLMEARMTYETADVFAWTVSVILISMLLEALLRRFLRRSLRASAKEGPLPKEVVS